MYWYRLQMKWEIRKNRERERESERGMGKPIDLR
jgi:hypothetical protein